jgi:phosphohistidine phosphatase
VEEPRRLVVLRHAKSAWPAVIDHERPLAPRGRRDAPAAGRWLHDGGYLPDQVICSTARRTRQTWEWAAPALQAAPPVTYDERVYDASVADLLTVIREVPASVATLLLIGHNPGMQELTLALASGGLENALLQVELKFPTAAIAVLSLPGPWSDAAPGEARLADLAIPRGSTSP